MGKIIRQNKITITIFNYLCYMQFNWFCKYYWEGIYTYEYKEDEMNSQEVYPRIIGIFMIYIFFKVFL